MLGFEESQYAKGVLNPRIGNLYSASSLMGLAAVLDASKPGDRILMVSFGSGAGSDAFDITVTDDMASYDKTKAPTVEDYIARGVFVDYALYAKFRKKILTGGE